MTSALPILLLPGLNGDPRVFASQAEAIPSLSVARWIPPLPRESLAAYAARLAPRLDPRGPCVIGGVSFGGIVALEAARHLDAKACVLIASTRDVRGLPAAIRWLRPLATAVGPAALGPVIRAGWSSSSGTLSPRFRRRAARWSAEERRFRQWALSALLTWKPTHPPPCPVLQIHGTRDATFPAARADADQFVPHAGHLLSLTHPKQVNAFLLAAAQRGAA